MKYIPLALCALAIAGAAALFLACTAAPSSSTTGGPAVCPMCVTDQNCTGGEKCSQFAGDTYCAPDCSTNPTCATDRVCTQLNGVDGMPIHVCVPRTGTCADTGAGGAGGAAGTSSHSASSSTASSSTATSSSSSSGTGGPVGSVGPSGGTLDVLSFAIVGDTRPPTEDDTAGYPTAVITKIWQDVEAYSPRPAFGITTGDYIFAKPYGSQAAPQMNTYLAARATFSNITFPAMGNHECTGATDSNCGQGNTDGITVSYTAFLTKMLAPINETLPYYTIKINATNNAWTSKFVFVAANAWSSAQATWFAAQLAIPTTYTFVVRHEGSSANTAPGVTPSTTIMNQHPYTLLIAGHTHTFEYFANEKQVIVGNGGAPLSGSINYGYVVAEQQPDGKILFKEMDYATNAVQTTFSVAP